MAAQSGVTTRLQSRKAREMASRHGKEVKRKTKDKLVDIEEENCIGAQYSRRSFPLQHVNDHCFKEIKKTSKTESSAKQKRTLSVIGENTEKGQNAGQKSLQQQRVISKIKSGNSKYRQVKDDLLLVDDLELFKASHDATSVFPMDTEVYASVDTSMMDVSRGVPYDVDDIDFDPNCLKTTVYSQDIIKYMMYLESRNVLKPDFLNNSPSITTKMRGVLMDWLLQVQNHEELKDETLHLCVDLIDRFLSVVNVEMPKLQLVGISCLLIASKFIERFSPEVSTLCYLTDNTFVKSEVLLYERLILSTLKFDLSKPVCVTFLDRFLQAHNHPIEVEYLAKYLLDLTITSAHLMPILPSLKAAAALYLSRLLLLDRVPVWTRNLHYYTSYSQESLMDMVTEMVNLLLKVRASKNQGAKNKYNTEHYKFISTINRVADVEWSLLSQFGDARDAIQ
ncbi:G2/mitotic-specific cyclin-B-like [Biomphalaria glabrata]|uniref:G2/mitotic-specific cyclin-B-like n=1 Tax=Biomphalaria glabrata TaxID=6526 RepID=A0A9W2ZTF2_BIOGL|nr:G2/mitotic-specific cyclin-B-like [Biomphalaria glabrata]